jgi:hypothetical protein
MIAVVTGMMGTYPVGGVAWDYGQYAIGLEQLGYTVYYLEDTGLTAYTFDEATQRFEPGCSYGLAFIEQSLAMLSPSLAKRWHFRSVDDETFGIGAEELADVIADADLFVNVSGGCMLRDEYRHARRKVFIDTDPGWNHFVIFPRWDAKDAERQRWGPRAHDHFFTFAQRQGVADCPLPSLGIDWQPTRHPVVPDLWEHDAPRDGDEWTTLMMWNNYEKPVEYGGRTYGAKEMEFGRVESIPARTSARFEVAVNGEPPSDRWRELGWSVVPGGEKSKSATSYRDYIAASRGEFSVAKNIYVATRSGWFSGRSACYLAAGRPVVVQDTGFSDVVPTGCGLLPFTDLADAADAIARVERDYDSHRAGARELARTYFDARVVLSDILERIGA